MPDRLHIEPGRVVCDDCRNPVVPSVPLEPGDLAPGDSFTCDGCGARIVSDEPEPPDPPASVTIMIDGEPHEFHLFGQFIEDEGDDDADD